MPDMNDRARAFETRFAQDAEMQFRAEARRNRLLGLWAAERLGRTGDEADAYAAAVVRADFEEAGPEDVIRKLVADLNGVEDEAAIRAKLAECEVLAKSQLADQSSDS
ncbi:DUF1476 domain-containing protein [Falsirhodobacter algicola]|uniref:DUF1476 family protein n=1 Tax=Falsirhodobacter algicola TaxID=2692330 RepID=A0A8J8SLN4_9RHOB|nr:DUF1476 domain-containing protein [Falsirhodobacter algicola]QUS36718.1 DUF1476 family protein [Falsirhodobacter algicola]